MKFKLFEKGLFDWNEPKGVVKLRDLIQYGNSPFWEKLTYRQMFSYLFVFSILFFPYYLNRIDDSSSNIKLIISAFLFAISIISILLLYEYISSFCLDNTIAIKKNSIYIQNGSNGKEIKWQKISNIELLTGSYQNRHYSILNLKQKQKILQTVFVSDVINLEYLINYFEKIGIYVTMLDLKTYLQKKGITIKDTDQISNLPKRSYKYPKEIWIGWLGLALFGLVFTLFVIYMGFQGDFDKKNEIYSWCLAILFTILFFIFGLLMYNEYSQEISVHNPYIIQKFKLKKIRKFNLSENLSIKLKSGSVLTISNSKHKISVDSKLIYFNDLCKDLERITNLHIFQMFHEAQYKNYLKGIENRSQ